MKHLTILSLLVPVALSINSCGNRLCCAAPPDSDQLIVKRGALQWTSKKQETSNYKDSLYITAQLDNELIRFRIKFNGEGKYVLTGNEITMQTIIEGNQTVMGYYADSTAESFLDVQHYPGASKRIYGVFKANLFRDHRYDRFDGGQYPQKLALTEGRFRIYLPKE